MKKVILFLLFFLIVCSAYGQAETAFDRWAKGIEEVVMKVKTNFGGRIALASEKHSLENKYLWALVVVESKGDPNAVSESGVRGLTMLTGDVLNLIEEETGVVIDPFHPYEALWGAGWNLNYLMDTYGFTIEEALAAYYYGPSGLREKLKTNSLKDLYYYKKIKYALKIIKEISQNSPKRGVFSLLFK